MRIVAEAVIPINPTNGVAVLSPIAMTSRGMPTIASPNPNVDRVNAAMKIIGNTIISNVSISILPRFSQSTLKQLSLCDHHDLSADGDIYSPLIFSRFQVEQGGPCNFVTLFDSNINPIVSKITMFH